MPPPTDAREPEGCLGLHDAWERWRDPELWSGSVEANRNAPRQGYIDDPEFWRLRRVASRTRQAVLSAFKRLLQERKLVGLGKPGSYSAPLSVIPYEAWRLARLNVRHGEVLLRDGMTYYSVRICEAAAFDAWKAAQQVDPSDGAVTPQPGDGADDGERGTPIGRAHLVHAAADLIEAHHRALDRWQAADSPAARTTGLIPILGTGGGRRTIEIRDPTLVMLEEAQAPLFASMWDRLRAGECVLWGFREDIERDAPVPREFLPTLKLDIPRRIATTQGGRTYHRLFVLERAESEARQSVSKAAVARRPGRTLLKQRVLTELRAMERAGELDLRRGGQASAFREICRRLEVAEESQGTVKSYVQAAWPRRRG